MIHTEFYRTREDGVNLYRTYSDDNRYIIQEQTGVEYVDAIDVEGKGYTYIEGNVIEKETEEFVDKNE